MQTVTLARNAMATRFEIVLNGAKENHLRAAGEEALEEIVRLENQLSLYRPGSEIAQINARAAHEAVLVSPEVFELLQHAQRLSAETEGAFDITIAPLVRCWGFMGGTGKMPTQEEVSAAREKVGWEKVLLDASNRTVRFTRAGVMLDLGAIGKGYAVERAADVLREAGIGSALIQGGTSTACAIGHPPESDFWKIAIDSVPEWGRRFTNRFDSKAHAQQAGSSPENPIIIPLRDESVSVSAASGRQFEFEGKSFGHVIDPRTGSPTEGAMLSIVVLCSATETDALSTALLTLGVDGLDKLVALRVGMKNLIVVYSGEIVRSESRGLSVVNGNQTSTKHQEQILR
jgi:FAD:protein FMN transferase